MSNNRCYICGNDPGVFFVWSSSRRFNRKKLMDDMKWNDKLHRSIISQGVKVCFGCNEKLKDK